MNWTFKADYGVGATIPHTCPAPVLNSSGDGYQVCEVRLEALAVYVLYLEDLTLGKYWNFNPKGQIYFSAAMVWVNSTGCASFVCSYSSASSGGPSVTNTNSTNSFWINRPLNHSHRYSLVVEIAAAAYSETYYAPKATLGTRAAAWADLSPAHGYGFSLNSIRLS